MSSLCDKNVLGHVRRLGFEPAGFIACPAGEGGKINPHATTFLLKNGECVSVFSVKPIYYETIDGDWRPLDEVASYYGNHRIDLKEDWSDRMSLRYLSWLLKRMDLIHGTIRIPTPVLMPLSLFPKPGHAQILMSTLTAYPDPNPETTTVDGQTKRQAAAGGEPWSNFRGGAGTASADSTSTDTFFQLNAYGGSPTGWYEIRRSIYLFDTSTLTSSASISSAVFSKWLNTKDDTSTQYALTAEIAIPAPASNTALANSDFNIASWTMTRQATGIAQGSLSTGAYNDFTLNSTGRGNISKTGVSKFGIVHDKDLDNSEQTMDGAHQTSYVGTFADNTGTSNDPKLVVTYTVASAANAVFHSMNM